MINYELTVLTKVDDAETLEGIEKTITEHGFTIQDSDFEGKKTLAYPMNGNTEAYYSTYCLTADKKAKEQELGNSLNIKPEVIRYLLVTVNPKASKK